MLIQHLITQHHNAHLTVSAVGIIMVREKHSLADEEKSGIFWVQGTASPDKGSRKKSSTSPESGKRTFLTRDLIKILNCFCSSVFLSGEMEPPNPHTAEKINILSYNIRVFSDVFDFINPSRI